MSEFHMPSDASEVNAANTLEPDPNAAAKAAAVSVTPEQPPVQVAPAPAAPAAPAPAPAAPPTSVPTVAQVSDADLDEAYSVNESMEAAGVWFSYPGIMLKMKCAGGGNPTWDLTLRRVMRKYHVKNLQKERDTKKVNKIFAECIVLSCLTDWCKKITPEGVRTEFTMGGNSYPLSPERALALFEHYPGLLDDAVGDVFERTNFREDALSGSAGK